MNERVLNGLDILLREGRGCRKGCNPWPQYEAIVFRAVKHIEACGGNSDDYLPGFKRELAEAMKL